MTCCTDPLNAPPLTYGMITIAIRAQANFAEYVPSGILLIACLELNGAPWWLVAIPGVTLVIGRLIHIEGINTPPPDFSKRVLGMKFTFNTLITLILANLGWSVFQLYS